MTRSGRPYPRCGTESDMLTPVAEAGQIARALSERIRAAFRGLAAPELRQLLGRIVDEARAAHVVYFHDDIVEPVPILVSPVPALPDQLSYVRTATLTLH